MKQHVQAKIDWELIDESHQRAKIVGGWLVRYNGPSPRRTALVFVPDPTWTWVLQ